MMARSSRLGFTIVELLVTITIIALLLTAAAAGIVRARKVGRDAQRIRDVMGIAVAVDQSARVRRGVYPKNPTPGGPAKFCAHELQDSNNTNKLDLSGFIARSIPKDPLPEQVAVACVDYRNGYVYHSRTQTGTLANPSDGADGFEYVIEVGLETPRSQDEATLEATGNKTAMRSQYLLNGMACSGGSAGSCSVP